MPKPTPPSPDQDLIKFLGTAGARFVVARQLRSSAGVYLQLAGKRVILDPGPGTLVRLATAKPKIDVTRIDAIILTHGHIDHCNDVNVLIDAMTSGGLHPRGRLFAPESCLQGPNAVVLNYLRDFPEEIIVLGESRSYGWDGLRFSTTIRHLHPVETYGLVFDRAGQKIAFMVDTRFFPELIAPYEGVEVLVMNVVRAIPDETGEILHLGLEDVRKILSHLRPKKTILTHFGMTMLKARPWEVAQRLTAELGLEVVAASDGMTLSLSDRP